jgi:Ca-activated chloride channel family protein
MAMAVATLTPTDIVAQGWIEPPLDVRGVDVVKTRSEVRARIDGRVALIEVTEWFRNTGGRVAQGHYLYPLPGEAVFQGFSLFQGDAELRGEIMDAERARQIYEEIVRRRADPALIELAGQGLLRARVFPIEPGQERKVTLRYTQVLRRAGDALQLVYAGAVRGDSRGSGARPDGAPDPETHFEVIVEDGDGFLDPFSPTHEFLVERAGSRLTARAAERVTGRLSLFLPVSDRDVGMSIAAHRLPGENGYFMLTLTPGRSQGRAEPRDLTVVMDVSGSMSGEKIEQARAALRTLLQTLSGDDRFRLVAFSNAVQMHRAEWSAASPANLREARTWVDRLVADGGTNIEGALKEAFRLETPGNRLPVVIFLTDGLPSVGEESPERLAEMAEARLGRARVFAFGVGPDVNTHLLDRMGEAGRGTTEYVEPGENVERAVGLLATKVRYPILTDMELAGAPVDLTDLYPVRLPDLFSGEELVLFGRYRGQGSGMLRIRGTRGGRTEQFAVEARFPGEEEANGFIPRLWAARKLGHLTRQVWTEGETATLVEEIRAVALRYGLPSPYTAYLVQEPDMVAGEGRRDLLQPADAAARPGTLPAASAQTASGAAAVRRAEEARRFREADSVEKLLAAESEMNDEVMANAANLDTRMVAGRVFNLQDGVWVDAARREGADRMEIQIFSPAYFQVIAALRELKPVLVELTPVEIAGERITLAFGQEGHSDLNRAELDDLVRRFRGDVEHR